MRSIRQRFGLIYYPLWVLRYTYRGRAYQVVVDGYSGLVLYGKAPGNTLYRAAVLVGGMAIGAFMLVDLSAAAFAIAFNIKGDGVGVFIVGGLAAIVIGFGLMATGYRKFRYGEQFEYRRDGPKSFNGLATGGQVHRPDGRFLSVDQPVSLLPLVCPQCATPVPAGSMKEHGCALSAVKVWRWMKARA